MMGDSVTGGGSMTGGQYDRGQYDRGILLQVRCQLEVQGEVLGLGPPPTLAECQGSVTSATVAALVIPPLHVPRPYCICS